MIENKCQYKITCKQLAKLEKGLMTLKKNKKSNRLFMDIHELKDQLISQIGTVVEKLDIEFDARKLVLTIKEKEVLGKIMQIAPRQAKPASRPSKEINEKIKAAKGILKEEFDSLYLYTLLLRTREELRKFSQKKHSVKAVTLIGEGMKDIGKTLSSGTKLLTQKGGKKIA